MALWHNERVNSAIRDSPSVLLIKTMRDALGTINAHKTWLLLTLAGFSKGWGELLEERRILY